MIEGSRIFYPQWPSNNQWLPNIKMACQEYRPEGDYFPCGFIVDRHLPFLYIDRALKESLVIS